MNKTWMICILAVSVCLLLVLKTHERRSLSPYFKSEPVIRLGQFTKARALVPQNKLHLLELWESMLTGRVAPLDRWMRKEYKTLALAHVFTPSGFHLTALLWPFLLLLKKRRQKLGLLSVIGILLSLIPGQSALKRMTSIKINQQFFGTKSGFLFALFLDVLFGSFTDSPLGFTYSFLFLGIIYSGARGITLIVWFYVAQVLIAFSQGALISPLLIFTSPIVNFILSLILPFLFLFSWPLTGWQLSFGLTMLEHTQTLVSFFYSFVMKFPLIEASIALPLIFILIFFRQGRMAILTCLLFSSELNSESLKIPGPSTYEWHANGKILKVVDQKIYREDGICERELVKGIWFETCSPRRRAGKKKSRKLSYLSEGQRKSFPHGWHT